VSRRCILEYIQVTKSSFQTQGCHSQAFSQSNLLLLEAVPSASVADFFDLFEAHCKPVLLSIAALHRIELPEKPTDDQIRSAVTKHILSGVCSQFSDSHPSSSLPRDLSMPNFADVCKEWCINNIDPNLQVHILTVIYGSKTSPNAMHRILATLDIHHEPLDPVRVLHEKLCADILIL
jgi:hypothetical protein